MHVLDGECEVVEDAVFVVGLDEFFLCTVVGQFECGSFCVWVLEEGDFCVVLGYFMSALEFEAYEFGVEVY